MLNFGMIRFSIHLALFLKVPLFLPCQFFLAFFRSVIGFCQVAVSFNQDKEGIPSLFERMPLRSVTKN